MTFEVAADTAYGETVLVSGSTAELGAWDPERAVPLSTSPGSYPRWSAEVALPPGGQIQYKYLRRSPSGAIVWESVPDRSAYLSPTGAITLDDRWNVAGGQPVVTVFNAAVDTRWGQEVYVTGDLAELGGWDPAKAVRLTTGAFVYPEWTGFASLPPNTAVRYKYLTKSADGVVTWEDGPDRTATTPPTGTFTVRDAWR
ncbi:CBM20 domain-containing protein [Kitasatospora camelliae]|uniref:alpha-amylase n=1 Tax=Kitasatospora camelliae TaxID=3156397 RepID=A0AAU8JQA6_9ACTN